MLNKNFNVCLIWYHLSAIANLIGSVSNTFPDLVQNIWELLKIKFNEVNLTFIAALNSVKNAFVAWIKLVYNQIYISQCLLVLKLYLVSLYLLLRNPALGHLFWIKTFGFF
jgi:hypothetical protein